MYLLFIHRVMQQYYIFNTRTVIIDQQVTTQYLLRIKQFKRICITRIHPGVLYFDNTRVISFKMISLYQQISIYIQI